MNVDLIDQIIDDVKKYIKLKSEYSPRVVKKSLKQNDKFPLITITQEDNSNILASTEFKETIDKLTISVNVYAEDMAVGNKTISNVNIVEELVKLTDDVIRNRYKMLRTSCRPTPNLDNTIYRMTAMYTRKIISNKNILI